MLREILSEAALKHSFIKSNSPNEIGYYSKKDDDSERYLIFFKLNSIISIDEIHEIILQSLPESFSLSPSFNKNCDLILIYRMEKLSEYKEIEKQILGYEENPYHFKKYFLYYISSEEKLLNGKSYIDIEKIISNKSEFTLYKKDPLRPSLYSLAARTFIKLPFLEMPKSESEFIPLAVEAAAAVSEAGAQDIYTTIQKLAAAPDELENILKGLIDNELENIKATNKKL